jgi:hypothetical protein
MATQSAAVMQRMNETEIVERSSEEILNQCSQTHELIARRARPIVVPGSILRVAGALMLSPQCAWLQRALENCSARSPDLDRLLSRNSTFI